VIKQIAGGQADTATVANVLNVIKEESVRDRVIAQAADAIKDDGAAYFSMYKATGEVAQATRDGWQNHLPTTEYLPEIKRHFDDVQVRDGYVIAKKPKRASDLLFQDQAGGVADDILDPSRPLAGQSDTVWSGLRRIEHSLRYSPDELERIAKQNYRDAQIAMQQGDEALAELKAKWLHEYTPDVIKKRLGALDDKWDVNHDGWKVAADMMEELQHPDAGMVRALLDTDNPNLRNLPAGQRPGDIVLDHLVNPENMRQWSLKSTKVWEALDEMIERMAELDGDEMLDAYKSGAGGRELVDAYWEQRNRLLKNVGIRGVHLPAESTDVLFQKLKLPRRIVKHLTDEEKTSLTSPTIGRLLSMLREDGPFDSSQNFRHYDSVDKTGEMVQKTTSQYDARFAPQGEVDAAVEAGLVKSGWYTRAVDIIDEMFGPEAPRFAALLSATSPRQRVQENMMHSIKLWAGWKELKQLRGDAPLTVKEIDRLGHQILGSKVTTGFPSRWKNVRRVLLSSDDELLNLGEVLSGPKVTPFARNLLGEYMQVTNDSWMAEIFGVHQDIFSAKAGYLAGTVRIRKAAEKFGITPFEAQAAAWSFGKALAALREGSYTGRQALDRMSHESVAALPEFFELLTKDADVLKELDRLGLRETASKAAKNATDYTEGFTGSVLAQSTHPTLLKRVADRIGSGTGSRADPNVVARGLWQFSESLGSAGRAGARGAAEFLEDGKVVIHALEAKDLSTFLHESAHVFRRSIAEFDDDLLLRAEQAIGVKNRQWTVDNEETFATAFESYLRDGNAPTKALQTVFEKFKAWLHGIYKSIIGSPLEDSLNPQLKEVFDEMLGAKRKHGLPADVVTALEETSDLFNASKDTIANAVIEMGGSWRLMDPNNLIDPDTGELAEGQFSSHFPRDVEAPKQDRHGRFLMEQGSEYAKARDRATRYVDADSLEEMSRSGADTPEKIMQMYPQHLSTAYTTARGKVVGKEGHAKDLAEFVKKFSGQGKQGAQNVPQNVLDEILRSGVRDQDEILARWGEHLDAHFEKGRGKHKRVVGKEGHAKDLARYVTRGGIKFREPMETMASYLNQGYRWRVTLNEIHRTLTQNLDRSQDGTGQLVRDLFNELGPDLIDTDKAMEYLSRVSGVAIDELERVRVNNEVFDGIRSFVKTQHAPEWAKTVGNALDKLNAWFKGAVTVATIPFTGIPLFPGFYARNFMSGQFVNISSGVIEKPQDILDYGNAIAIAFKLKKQGQGATGFGIDRISEIVDPELQKFYAEMAQHKVIGHGYGYDFLLENPFKEAIPVALWKKGIRKHVRSHLGAPDAAGNVSRTGPLTPGTGFTPSPDDLLDDLTPPTLGKKVTSKLASGAEFLRQQMHESYARGGLIKQHVAYANRAPLYIYLRKKGWSETAASLQVKKMHFDYNDLSPFEQDVVKRVIPFYTFTRKMAGLTADTLTRYPGGMMRQTLRNAQYGNAAPGTPDYVAEQLALPLEGTPFASTTPGEERYFTGFGLGHEDPLSFIAADSHNIVPSMLQKGGLEVLSRMGPIPKMPLEWFTQELFFQKGPLGGRDIDDADPVFARTLQNIEDEWITKKRSYEPKPEYQIGLFPEFLLSNSGTPARLLQTIRTLNDPRKSLPVSLMNTLTGFRLTDVSAPAKDAILRERARDIMDDLGARSYTNTYFSKAQKAAMTPEERTQADQLTNLLNVLRARGRRRKKEREKAGE